MANDDSKAGAAKPGARDTAPQSTVSPPQTATTPAPDGARPRRRKTEPSRPAVATPPVSDDPYLNTVIADRYRVLRKLGEGGMGVVYLAEHVFIEKRVALKILSDDFARKADLVQRFMQEAKAASKIGHENIVDITDFGETASGSVFFAMEFLEGADLAHHIKKGPIPFQRARLILTQICRALGAAHAKGIVHRDLKPENIFLIDRSEGRGEGRQGQKDFVKILDFGIAKMSALDDASSRLTRTGMIFGTPEYMSPEQAKGERPDHRVDIYAAGCILYEMLTGSAPFAADTFMGVLTKHMFEAPEAPSARAPDLDITDDVEAVVLRALAKDRDKRFQTMKEFAVALAECSGGDLDKAWEFEGSGVWPPRDRSSSSIRRMKRGSSTTKKVAGAVFAVCGLAAVATVWRSSVRPSAVAATFHRAPVTAPAPAATAPVPPAAEAVSAPAAPIAQAPSAPAVAAAPPATSAPSEPATGKSKFKINSDPMDVDIFRGDERVGVTPYEGYFDASDGKIELALRKKGYQDFQLTIDPSRGAKELFTQLTAVRPPRESHSHHHSSHSARPASAHTGETGSSDLKNPF